MVLSTPPIIVIDDIQNYGPTFTRVGIIPTVRRHSIRNWIEHSIQELKRRVDAFYSSFTGRTVDTTHNWLRQFGWNLESLLRGQQNTHRD